MTVAELFARIGIKADDAQAKKFHSTMKVVKVGMLAVTAAATGVSLAIKAIATEAMNGAVALKQFEVETGASAQELQKWQAVALQTNQSAESVTNAIKAIAANQEKIKLGQGNISGFQLLGIDPRQDPFKILEQLRDKTDGVSQAMKKNLLSQLGIGSGLMQTLDLSRDAFDEMASRAFIISPQAIETLNKTKANVDLLGRAFKYIKTQIAVGLAPQITELTKKFSVFIKVNEKGIIKGFQAGYKYVKLFVGAIISTGRVINNLVQATVGWERAIKLLAVGFGILAAVMNASPMGFMIAGIILLIALIDDLYVYSQGGKSMFGELMNNFPELEKGLFGFLDKLREVRELFASFRAGDAGGVRKILEQWGALGAVILATADALERIDFLLNSEKYDVEAASARTSARVKEVGGFEDYMADPGKFAADINKAIMGNTGAERALGSPINNINVNVYGSTDPVATGDAAALALKRQLNAASSQMSRNE